MTSYNYQLIKSYTMAKIEITPKSINQGSLMRIFPNQNPYFRMTKTFFFLNVVCVQLLRLKEKDSVIVVFDSSSKKFSIKKGKGFKTSKHPTEYKRTHRFKSSKLRTAFIKFFNLNPSNTYQFPLHIKGSELIIGEPYMSKKR